MYRVLKAIVGVLFKLIYRINVKGIENIPKDGAFIVSANHTHIFDPIVLAVIIDRQVFFLAKKELFKNKIFSKFFSSLGVIAIDRKNNDFKAIKMCFKVIRNKNILGIFPEGTRVKNVDISNMKKGVALIALKNDTNIVPIHIDASYKIFSKINIEIYKKIEVNEFKNLDESEAIDKLTEKLFNSIYQK